MQNPNNEMLSKLPKVQNVRTEHGSRAYPRCEQFIYHPNILIFRLCQVIRICWLWIVWIYFRTTFFFLIFVQYFRLVSTRNIITIYIHDVKTEKVPLYHTPARTVLDYVFYTSYSRFHICIWIQIIGSMKRRNGDCGKSRKALKRNKSAAEGIYWRYLYLIVSASYWSIDANRTLLFLVPYIIWNSLAFGSFWYYLIIYYIFGLNTFGHFGFCFIESLKE